LQRWRDGLLDRPFALIAGIYVAVVALCSGCMLCSYCMSSDYVAARELKNNHRIVAGDLRRQSVLATSLGFYTVPPPSLAGKYVTADPSIAAGLPVGAAALAASAHMKLPDKNTYALPFPLLANSPLLALLDVGSPVALVGQGADSKPIPATVHAIVCQVGKSDTDGCYPILRIAQNRIQDVVKDPAALRLVLGPEP
jgi:hypothetical protein